MPEVNETAAPADAATETDPELNVTDEPKASDSPKVAEDEPLGPAGKKALNAEREARKAAEKAQTELAARLKEYEDRDKTQAEKLADRLAEAEKAAATATAEALRFRIASKHQISDEDAEAFLSGSDEDTLTRQAERLVALRGETRRFQGSADGGARNGSSKPSQLTRDDLKAMSPAQIVQAKAEGRLTDLLGA